ncbi:3-octaprenyl-4-hydroxybenzoate carboxy-lyase [Poriferisphaera corsica]|uniref:3-octaprenyl-4-hydroxybenzoate carboxy-lyase n=1 Tax=Poriferisphaera corsica TaxID=2528020 RepID=A0A517YTS0_9BACT|nr:UbiD family decarboxylase [Poriferisphaera corsica]QDU33617.1 3-octaprenyl-4-hydroxybenzoate carboxy-lyase [Poriferisphaera corsica]
MAFRDLQQFIAALESEGELHRISATVSPHLEVTEITDRVSKSPAHKKSIHAKSFDPHHAHLGGKALYFENIESSKHPLLINAYGSYRRLELALGCADIGLQGLADKIDQLLKPVPPSGLMDKMKKGLELAKIASFAPKVVKSGLSQQNVITGNDINLLDLPVIKCWPKDGDPTSVGYPLSPKQAGTAKGQGRYITLAHIYTIHPDDAGKPDGTPRPSRNVGMYRAQLIDEKHTAMHWHIHHDGAAHWRAWKKIGKPMPCAIVLGGESVLPYAATAPLPPGISELLFAGFLNNASIPLVKCKTIDMHVPANAEFVIEGHVDTTAASIGYDPRTGQTLGPGAVFEGPFGDHTGFYSLPDRYPIFTASALTHRNNPIYPTTIVGLPPQEDYYLGKATERLFLPPLRTLVHDVIDYDLPMFGCFHNCAFIKIDKQYPLQARRVMHAIWGAGQMAWTKSIVIVDKDVDVHDHEQVLFQLAANCDPGRDIEIVNGPLDILDHAAPRLGAGHKIGFDATRKIPGEECNGHPIRDYPPILEMSPDIKQQVTERWHEFGL